MLYEFGKHDPIRVEVDDGPFVSTTYNLRFSKSATDEGLTIRVLYPHQARYLASKLEEAADELREMAEKEDAETAATPPAPTLSREGKGE